MIPSGKLKILFIARQYPPDMTWGGIGPYVACMATRLVARGHEVHVLSCAERQEYKDYLDQGVYIHCRRGVVPIRGYWRARRFLKYLLRAPKTIWRFEKGLETFFEYRRLGINFDIIEYPDWGAMGSVFALLHNRPLVATLHTPPPSAYQPVVNRDMLWANSLVYYSTRRADVSVISSLFHVQKLKDDGWLLGDNVQIIPYPIDWTNWCNTRPVLDSPPTALFIGRLEKIKAPEVLVEAISIVRKKVPEATALFVGGSENRDGLPYIEWIKKTVTDISGCQFVGRVPRHELSNFLSLSRVLVMPSVFDVYPIAVLEAMAAARPVLVSANTGIAELVREVGAGRVIPAGDAKVLAEALEPFLTDATYAAKFGDRARAAVQDRLDPDKIADQREKVYFQAIEHFNHKN